MNNIKNQNKVQYDAFIIQNLTERIFSHFMQDTAHFIFSKKL
jgi:hypothetical protein